MHYTIGRVLRVSFGLVVSLVVLAGCSTLMVNREQALRDHVAKNHDADAIERIDRWLALRRDLLGSSVVSELDKVRLTNDFFNALPWRADADNWNREDFWATPLETLLNNGGDCEDLAIAKYFTLLAGGIEPDRLRLTYVWQLALSDNGRRQAHMVLAYFSQFHDEPLILDNLNQELRALPERADLQAVYSFNASKLWLAEDFLQPVRVDSQLQLEKWRNVNQRMLQEAEQRYWPL